MKNQPAGRLRTELRRSCWRTVTQMWVVFPAVAAAVVLYAGFLALVPTSQWWRGLCLGFVLGALCVAILWMVQLFSGSSQALYGSLGEQSTAEALKTRRMQRQGWSLVNGLYFAQHGDVDHVLIGPGGVYAIESKWTNRSWEVAPICRSAELSDAMFQARRGARKITSALRAHHLADGLEVSPVVVVWGPGSPAIPGGWTEDSGVIVVEGRSIGSWVAGPWRDRLEADCIFEVAGALRGDLAQRVR
jgi:nuclease-like protein